MPAREVPRDVQGERARSDDQEDCGTDDRGGALHDRSIPNAAANRADWTSAGVSLKRSTDARTEQHSGPIAANGLRRLSTVRTSLENESRCAAKSLGSRQHRTQASPASCSLCCPCPRVRRAAALPGDIPDGPACECSIYRPRWPCPAELWLCKSTLHLLPLGLGGVPSRKPRSSPGAPASCRPHACIALRVQTGRRQ